MKQFSEGGLLAQQARDWINQAIEKAGGIQHLSKIVGVKSETIRSWVQPAHPRLRHLEMILKYLEGDISLHRSEKLHD